MCPGAKCRAMDKCGEADETLYTKLLLFLLQGKQLEVSLSKLDRENPLPTFFLLNLTIPLFFLIIFNVTVLYFRGKKFVTPGAQAFHSTWGLGR